MWHTSISSSPAESSFDFVVVDVIVVVMIGDGRCESYCYCNSLYHHRHLRISDYSVMAIHSDDGSMLPEAVIRGCIGVTIRES